MIDITWEKTIFYVYTINALDVVMYFHVYRPTDFESTARQR